MPPNPRLSRRWIRKRTRAERPAEAATSRIAPGSETSDEHDTAGEAEPIGQVHSAEPGRPARLEGSTRWQRPPAPEPAGYVTIVCQAELCATMPQQREQ